MSDTPDKFEISAHFVPSSGERMPTEEEISIWADLAQNGDRIVSHPTRQAILYLLFDGEPRNMTALQAVTELSTGGVALHLRRLEEAGYITVEKYFDERRRARTSHRITAEGREAVNRHRAKEREAKTVDLSNDL